jgi:hypothetical protein
MWLRTVRSDTPKCLATSLAVFFVFMNGHHRAYQFRSGEIHRSDFFIRSGFWLPFLPVFLKSGYVMLVHAPTLLATLLAT